MVKNQYPLESLARLRKQRLEGAERSLADAVRACGAAERARDEARRASEAHREATAAIERAERVALSRGERRAMDLTREGAWAMGRRVEALRLAEGVAVGEQALERARTAERDARAVVTARAADVRVMSEHMARWHAAQQARAERVEEDAAMEAWRPEH
jgi:hypothetical protein